MANLIGKTTDGGWNVVESVPFPPDHTGGNFSDCYFATKNGTRAFVKFMDLARAGSFDELLQAMSEFKYETQLVSLSTQRGLSRVVKLLEHGELAVDPTNPIAVLRAVPYLVFELGDGDIRSSVDISKGVTDKWKFSVLHGAAAALVQLHKNNIAHQDLKPSNVVRMNGEDLKIADLGRSSLRGTPAPHDVLKIAGALKYAPFELSYSYFPEEWINRRIATDVFHVGCLLVYVFTNVVMPSYVISRLAPAHRPNAWGDSYLNVMPHVIEAFERSLAEIANDFPAPFRDEVVLLVRDLCNPDPRKRGTGTGPRSNVGTTLWLEKFVSRFNALEMKAAIQGRR